MAMQSIPEPILTPYPRKSKPALTALVQIPIPRPEAAKAPEAETPKAADTAEKKKQKLPPIPQAQNPPAEPEDMQVILGVDENGKPIPAPFKKVDPLTILDAPSPTVAMVMVRQLKDMRGDMPDTSNGALAVLVKVEEGLKAGRDITELNSEVSNYIVGEDAHHELFSRLTNAVDRERAIEIFKSRSKWEDFCHACMRRGDLTVVEGMAIMAYFNTELSKIFSRSDKARKTDLPQSRESLDLIEGVNRPTLVQHKELQRKFEEAPPQEREILRKIGFKLEKALAARITKTTQTETVEIIQQDGSK